VNPLKTIHAKPYHNDRITHWLMLMTEFDLKFIPQKSIKGQVIADQLANAPLSDTQVPLAQFPDEYIQQIDFGLSPFKVKLFFDGSKC
ncbi:hypothetical protein KI387_012418, partial [Taxus chinensis]